MKRTVLFLLLISSFNAFALDLDMHSEINIISSSNDIGIDLVTNDSQIYFSTGLYRDQAKKYGGAFESEGIYFGFGKHFKINSDLSVDANAKFYESEGFSSPMYGIRITQRLSLF